MKRMTELFFKIATALIVLLYSHQIMAQMDTPIHPSITGNGVFLGVTPPLRDLPVLSPEDWAAIRLKAEKKALNMKLEKREFPHAKTALPQGPDPVWQRTMGSSRSALAPIVNFDGQTSPYYPPDANGTAGPNHFMQTINCVYAIYNKTGSLVAGPTNMNLLFGSVTGATYNDGDPLILYDDQAQRWLAVEFSISGSNDYMLVAVSTTNDPTGTWYKYSFDVADMPDYEKFGIWQDGYYMGTNNSSGNDIYVFERAAMLTGAASPKMVGFDNAWRPTTVDGFMCLMPVDNDGAFAPAGSPGLFVTINDDAVGGGSDQLWIYELAVNWTTTSSSTFTRSQQLSVPSFDSNFGSNWDNITQPNTQKLDAIPMIIMNIPQYRNFGSYQTLVCCHTVDLDATNHAGIRWYELRRTTGSTWTLRQSGTYGPDAQNRWMGSIMLNGSGQIALGYSVSSSTVYPSIRYCGQSGPAYNSATGTLDIPEESIIAGAYAQTTYNRWGDYALMSVDPTDDKTFWFTTEYIGSGGSRKTRIASFKFGNSPTVNTLAATSIASTSATINGSLNPNGLATNYYFDWGTTTGYGNTTPVTSAGSGSSTVNVNALLSGLTPAQVYHFRIVAVNTDGTTNGSDMSFTPGAAALTTTAISSITTASASSGGNISTDGGSAITARGVCWATTANPTVSGSHTTDGSGTGSFISSITGLSANTVYHVRAYATNANGTFYGDDVSFTTLCGNVTAFPWNEGFENAGLIPSCWTQEQVNSSGLNWTFVTGNAASNPATAHGGTYDACLKDASTGDNITRLITPSINLTGVASPQLKFWHTQQLRNSRQDQLLIYYRTSATGTWTLLASYTASITSWTQETLSLPSPSADYYIAFQGNAKYGYGVCVDDVQVISSCVSTNPVSVSIASSANPVCLGSSVTFTATPVNGGTAPGYQWNVNGTNVTGATNATYTFTPTLGSYQVYCTLNSNASCTTGNPAGSNTITQTVSTTQHVGVTIAASANNICAGAPVTFTATQTNGGTSPAYQWRKNAANISGATNVTYTCNPLNNDVFTCVLTSNAACPTNNPDTSNAITMVVNPVQSVSVSISASANPVCAGSVVSFTATPTNGGTNPSYQWRKGDAEITGATNSTWTFTPANGDIVTCILSSGVACPAGNPAISNEISMTVDPVLLVSISINESENPVDEGTPVTFTAYTVNGGLSPVYQWKVNGINTGAGNDTLVYIPANGDNVNCTLTSDVTCPSANPVVSNIIVMNVNAVALNTIIPDDTAGDWRCYQARQTITAGGPGTGFVVINGGIVSMIAGQNILFYEGMSVDSGGYLHAYIAPEGPWCMPPAMPSATGGTTLPSEPVLSNGYRVFPNPTTGYFYVEPLTESSSEFTVEIYTTMGQVMARQSAAGNERIRFSLEGQPKGLYMVRISDSGRKINIKLLKQ